MPELNDRVRVETSEDGRYDGKTGTVVQILNGAQVPLEQIPENSPQHYPYWFRVRFDVPADHGGGPIETNVFLNYELKKIK